MKKLLPLLLLTMACASPTAVIDRRALQCGPGQPIEIRAGIDPDEYRQQINRGMYLVEVANNSHEDVTVKMIRISPSSSVKARSGIDSAYGAFDETIAGGDDHLFRIPFNIGDQALEADVSRRNQLGGQLVFSVIVDLANGDSYVCRFSVEERR